MDKLKPREKLVANGADSLSEIELLAILLRTGSKKNGVLNLAEDILDQINNLKDLKRLTVEELMMIDGVKLAKACTIISAIELGKRLAKPNLINKVSFRTLHEVYYYLREDYTHLEQEHLVCLYLNNKSSLIKLSKIYIGTLSQMIIHPRDIFNQAIKLNAAFILLVHNHPSGDSTPSEADIAATKKLISAGELVGIGVTDHLIIGNNEYYSIKQGKKVKF